MGQPLDNLFCSTKVSSFCFGTPTSGIQKLSYVGIQMTTFWNDQKPKLKPNYTPLRWVYYPVLYPSERGILSCFIPLSKGYIWRLRGVYYGPLRGVYYGPLEGYIWSAKQVYGFPKGYIWGSKKCIFFVLEGYVWKTHPYIWCTTSSVYPKLNFIRWDYQIILFYPKREFINVVVGTKTIQGLIIVNWWSFLYIINYTDYHC